MRDRVTQAENQGFPPEYGRILEEFYRRLARVGDPAEKGVAPVPPDPKPASAPAKEKN